MLQWKYYEVHTVEGTVKYFQDTLYFGECISLIETPASSDRDGDTRATFVKQSSETLNESKLEPVEPRAHLSAIGVEACVMNEKYIR